MIQKQNVVPATVLLLAPFAMGIVVVLSVVLGAKQIALHTVWDALFHFDPDNIDHQIIRTSRVPRAIGSLMIGAFLAISGALMQGMTRNYLASPSILGVSDGSVFVVTLAVAFLPDVHSVGLVALSMIGSAIGVGLVFGLAWLVPNGLSPVGIAILGTIVGTFLNGVAAATAMYKQISQDISFWYNARLDQMDPGLIKISIPFAVVGIILAMFLSRSVTLLSLGEEISANLGVRTKWVKGLTMLSVVILTGVSVALAGKIAFIGLIVPHIARFISGIDYRWIVPVSGVIGGSFLVVSDLLARFVNYPFETPVGVVTALFGVPFFLYLIKTRGGGKHA
ncbi:iron chelate uptake ABC transporter family permease subunit [Paenibacillus sp. MMS18-CY102]|nr:iron ABC transporter permease [Paenibacillus sp. MMS18-CY102]MWC31342.1 iron chelate uptake ABC transporter family permease subunit [Paenibacillus sp. MMS18-CY102]